MNSDPREKVDTRRKSPILKGGNVRPNRILKENIRAYQINPVTGEIFLMEETSNQIQYGMCDILIMRAVGYDDYAINTMYFEYYNAAFLPAPATPTFTRDEQLAYYTGLPANRDFLRVPLIVSPYMQSTDSTRYSANMATLYAMSSGFTEGHNGEPFTVAAQSTVIGLALVVAPDAANQSEDIVAARSYLANGIPIGTGRAVALEHSIYAVWE